MKRAIYLSGGGARAAYQAGALKAIQEITQAKHLPVEVLSSVSAGSINAAYLAMHAKDFACAADSLIGLWSSLCCHDIFLASNFSLIKSVLRNVFSMIFHYPLKQSYLLDTKPLKDLLDKNVNFEELNRNIEQGVFTDFEVATSCYDTGNTISFFKSNHKEGWKGIGHIAVPANIHCQHILASASLPLFFPAVEIDDFHFGDGGLDLTFPLSSAIKLGAEKILIIGTRHQRETLATTPVEAEISFGKILGNMLNALFFDNLDKDLELLEKINNNINQKQNSAPEPHKTIWKKIDIVYLRPSQDLAKLAQDKLYALPVLLRYLMSVFGKKEQSGDILSFLLFEPAYSKKLIEIGYADTMSQKDTIADFFQ